jgi:hypothetical protein
MIDFNIKYSYVLPETFEEEIGFDCKIHKISS